MATQRRLKAPSAAELLESDIARAGSIGELERMAGITDRPAFWRRYAVMPLSIGIHAGVAELKRIIRQRRASGLI